MAIERVNIPTPTAPTSITDYQAILAQGVALGQALTDREIVDGSTIRAGTVMLIGGVLYKSTTDTTITGLASNYVKITPSGATASAAFVANLTGVTFNEAYGGYYDGSGNLHVFDEAKAIYSVAGPTTPRTRKGSLTHIYTDLVVKGTVKMGDTLAPIYTAPSTSKTTSSGPKSILLPALNIGEIKHFSHTWTNTGGTTTYTLSIDVPGTYEYMYSGQDTLSAASFSGSSPIASFGTVTSATVITLTGYYRRIS